MFNRCRSAARRRRGANAARLSLGGASPAPPPPSRSLPKECTAARSGGNARRGRGLAPQAALALHRDERGAISLLSVFSLLLLTMLLGMVMNVGRQVDRKVRMQNAADAATYSGGVMLARGMNSLAFTNHLLCDVFALTAYMREARDRDAEKLAPNVLAAWGNMAPYLAAAPLPKFVALGQAIPQKIPLEQEMIRAFSEWAAASSQLILPTLEMILAQELIPKYQRTVVQAIPHLAQLTAQEIARQHGLLDGGSGDLYAMLWRTTQSPVGLTDEGPGAWTTRTLPVVDPIGDWPISSINYVGTSVRQRHFLSHKYLSDWNDETLRDFDSDGQLSYFAGFWRGFTCGKLDQLLNDEYPNRNLLFVIRTPREYMFDRQGLLEREFNWLGIAYRTHLRQTLPGLYRNRMAADDQAYAQIAMFIPRPRLVNYQPGLPPSGELYGGVPGSGGPPAASGDSTTLPAASPQIWWVRWEGLSREWDLLNQNWTVQLVPATTPGLVALLSTQPPGLANVRVPNLQNFSPQDLQRVNMH